MIGGSNIGHLFSVLKTTESNPLHIFCGLVTTVMKWELLYADILHVLNYKSVIVNQVIHISMI